MSTKIFFAIMGCTRTMHTQVIELGTSVHTTMYANPTVYLATPMSGTDLKLLLDAAIDAQGAVKTGGIQATIKRDAKVGAMYDALGNKFLPYVNGLWKGNQQNLSLSGFPVSKEPEPIGAPNTPLIKRIEKGVEPGTVKILLEKRTGTASQRKCSLIYSVFMTDDPIDETKLKLMLVTSNSHELIIHDVPRGVDQYYCVSARHRKIGTQLCSKVRFMLN
jgi:hypothetical protein